MSLKGRELRLHRSEPISPLGEGFATISDEDSNEEDSDLESGDRNKEGESDEGKKTT